jgi:3-oxoacyl-[acyl-carrier protein] reductase
MIDLSGLTALITGGSRGIGRAAALLLARSGADVAITYHTRAREADATAAEVRSLGRRAFVVGGDLADPEVAQRMASGLEREFGGAVLPLMRPGGRVVIVSSTAGQRGEAYHSDYAATKGALIALTKSLAVEYATTLVVNCVAPGWVDTEMSAPAFTPENRERIRQSIPIGRIASAEDIAGPILFLCSDLARHVTGEVLNVNGGSVLCG